MVEKRKVSTAQCGEMHGPTLPQTLTECGKWKAAFWDVWDEAWDPRQKQAARWRSTATDAEKVACAMLRISKSLVKALMCKGSSLSFVPRRDTITGTVTHAGGSGI